MLITEVLSKNQKYFKLYKYICLHIFCQAKQWSRVFASSPFPQSSLGSFSQEVSATNWPGFFSTYLQLETTSSQFTMEKMTQKKDNWGCTWWCRRTQRRSCTARTLLHLTFPPACPAWSLIDQNLCWLHSVQQGGWVQTLSMLQI